MKRFTMLTTLALLAGYVAYGCSDQQGLVGPPSSPELAPVFSLTDGPSFTTDLIADGGQPPGIDVGSVIVSQNGFELTVKYEIDEPGWCLLETHFEVGNDLDEIPQRNGNPTPGKFRFGDDDLQCTPNYEETVDLSTHGIGGGTIVIATHARVVSAIDACSETVWQIGDVEVVNDGTGWLENYADEFNWVACDGVAGPTPTSLGPSLAVCQPTFSNPFVVGTTPDNEFPYNSNYSKNYATDFAVHWSGALYFGGEMTISWSPGASAHEQKKISTGDGFTEKVFSATGSPTSGAAWFLDKYKLVENSWAVDPLANGLHTIRFRHTRGDGTFWDWIRLTKPCEREESAWGAGEGFPGRNWAMYFNYSWAIIGGWDLARGGAYAIPNGGQTNHARDALADAFDYVELREVNYLSLEDLSGLHALVLSSVRGNSAAITPLSPDEQQALGQHVEGGKCAVLFPDNSAFGGSGTDDVNESLIDPFGLDITGNYGGSRGFTVTLGSSSPVVAGVTGYRGNYVGFFDLVPSSASILATLDANEQPGLVEFAPGESSGRVVVFSDANVIATPLGTTNVENQKTLFANAVMACFR